MILKNSDIVASYKTATLIPYALSFIPNTIAIYIYPNFARNNKDRKWIKEKYLFLLKYFSVFNVLVACFLFVFAPFIIQIVFGEQYLSSLIPFRILSIGYFFSATFRALSSSILIMLRKVKVNLIISIIVGIINIVLDIFLIKHYGAAGASIATVISFIIASFCTTLFLFKWFNKAE